MKTIIKSGIIILTVCLFLVLGYMLIATAQRKKDISNTIQTLPRFTATDMHGKTFSDSNLKEKVPVIFTFFNSGCDFCQYEARDIRENIHLFNNIQLLFLSAEPPELVRNFAQRYDLAEYSHVVFLHDANNKISDQFGISLIPTSLIYNKDRQLVRIYKGQVKATDIIRELVL